MKVTAFLLAAMIQTSNLAAQGKDLAPPTNLWALAHGTLLMSSVLA